MARYTVGVIREFIAQHYLIGGDWGRENEHHSHPYKLEVIFAGDELDQHGYLLDIAVVGQHLQALVERYKDKTLNTLPEFAGLNPSLEHFARILAERMTAAVPTDRLTSLEVKLWENLDAFTTHTIAFR
jgi:6-pyruvoyltetrahydropterin/6-carboxytetrahydropterin synthase